jgi:hypothetical protein
MSAAIASKSWRWAFMVCGDGLRVPRSARNGANHCGRITEPRAAVTLMLWWPMPASSNQNDSRANRSVL